MPQPETHHEIAVIIPCYNEAPTIAKVVQDEARGK